jgi:hypothetical protein
LALSKKFKGSHLHEFSKVDFLAYLEKTGFSVIHFSNLFFLGLYLNTFQRLFGREISLLRKAIYADAEKASLMPKMLGAEWFIVAIKK